MTSRNIFEEVSTQEMPKAPGPIETHRKNTRRLIAYWLLLMLGLVALMVLIGGMTRLTDSGLSITEWNVVFGVLPPFSESAWQAEFALYQTTDEFQIQNHAMDLGGFKVIYYWEWGHRLLGRVLGLAYLLPLLYFVLRKLVPNGWNIRLWIGFTLIALQGVVGWWMVKSGLIGRLDVAPYRLAAHLGMAFLLFTLILTWVLRLWQTEVDLLQARRRRQKKAAIWAHLMLILCFAQILLGALVAGLDAGKQFIDWPLMNGQFFPSDTARSVSGLYAVFEDPAITQFNHRILAYLMIVLSFVWWHKMSRSAHGPMKRWAAYGCIAINAQALLGITTLMHAAPVSFALAHQMMALLVIAVLTRAAFEANYPKAVSVRQT